MVQSKAHLRMRIPNLKKKKRNKEKEKRKNKKKKNGIKGKKYRLGIVEIDVKGKLV